MRNCRILKLAVCVGLVYSSTLCMNLVASQSVPCNIPHTAFE